MGWTRAAEPELKEAVRLARIAVEHGSDDPEALAYAAFIIGAPGRDLRGAISLAENALAHNPYSIAALSVIAYLQVLVGDSEMSIDHLDRAARLNPLEGSDLRNNVDSLAHFRAGRYEAAVEFARKALNENPNFIPPLRRLAALLGLLGRVDEAREVVQRLLAISPDQSISLYRANVETEWPETPSLRESLDVLCEGLRRAGLPE
jgi:tetratricopeptide (TPR) repeat protein